MDILLKGKKCKKYIFNNRILKKEQKKYILKVAHKAWVSYSFQSLNFEDENKFSI